MVAWGISERKGFVMLEVGYELEMGVDAPSCTIRGAVKAIFAEIADRNSSKERD